MRCEIKRYIDAVIFDLDGVITDTAEYHYQAWKRLADEQGIPFTRADNEKLRGVSRRKSLELLLDGRPVSEDQMLDLMERKNRDYQDRITAITPRDLLPGAEALLDELARAGIKIAIASASRNAPVVVERLGIAKRIDVLAHGGSVERPKPAPDLFLFAARRLGTPPVRCLVVEDAEAGVEAAQAAGMIAVGLGPPRRVGAADLVIPSLEGVTLDELGRATGWRASEPVFEAYRQHHRESLFTLGNGYLSTRGTLEEGYPGDKQATLIHGIWDDVPLSSTELANAPDWTALEIRVDGNKFKIDPEWTSDYARYLDLRSGRLFRRLCWTLPEGQRLELVFERFTSLADQHILALRLSATMLAGAGAVEVRAYLNDRVENEGLIHWDRLGQSAAPDGAELSVRARHSGKLLAMSQALITSGVESELSPLDCPGCPGQVARARLETGQRFVVEKLVTVYTSRDVSDPLQEARLKKEQARSIGYETLRAENQAAWAEFWQASDVVIEGDDEAQLALRHALFQLRNAAPTQDQQVSIGAKTLSGFGYRGHVFWDTEIFVLPFFTYTQPELARNLLAYRYHALPGARRKASARGYPGAFYAWESAETGDEVTPTWIPSFEDPAKLARVWTGDQAYHINAAIAYALYQYWQVTGDEVFWRDCGVPILLETAVFWGEVVEPENGRFVLRNVVGPDEYHDTVDNNAYTNRMIQWHLGIALESLDWLRKNAPDQEAAITQRLDLNPARLAHWRQVIENLVFLQDPETGLIEQFEGFFDLKEVDWAAYANRTKSMHELLGIEGANQHQAIKQADVIMLLCLLREKFRQETWRVNWDYYEPRTDHSYGSSLSPAMYAWGACELGMPEVAYAHFMRAARADLENVRGNAGDGIHAASAGGVWQAVVFGFAGLRLTEAGPEVLPRLPAHWRRLTFVVDYRGQRYEFDLRPQGQPQAHNSFPRR